MLKIKYKSVILAAALSLLALTSCERDYDEELRIYFAEFSGGMMHVCSVDIYGNGKETLSSFPGYTNNTPTLAVSPDGKYIVVSFWGATYDLFMVSADGGGKDLIRSSTIAGYPTFTYSGSRIALSESGNFVYADLAGNTISSTTIASGLLQELQIFCLSDADNILYGRVRDAGVLKLFRIDTTAGTRDLISAQAVTWVTLNPDKGVLYFTFAGSLYNVNVNPIGTPVSIAADVQTASLSPDGKYIAATDMANSILKLLDANGNTVRTLATGSVYSPCFQYRPR